jgi:hypothetical protein
VFERVIYNTIVTAIADADANDKSLRRWLTSPGWDVGEDGGNDEIAKLVAAWKSGDEKPQVRVNFPRDASQVPCFAITLQSENPDVEYLDHHPGFYEPHVVQFVADVEEELGRPIKPAVKRFKLAYSIITYATNPDVTLAFDNFLRRALLYGENAMLLEGFEDPTVSAVDLMPAQQYLPTPVYTRQRTIQGFAHLLYAEDIDLGPLAVGRGTKVDRIFVNDDVTGVNPGVDTFEDE